MDGLLILETMDKINPGVVDWKKVGEYYDTYAAKGEPIPF